MSASIRPPGAKPPGIAGPDGLGDAAGGAPSAEHVAKAPQAGSAAAPEGASAEWLQRLHAGEISKTQAVEGLVAHALDTQGAAGLSPARRAELAEVLRQSLLHDPVLGGLLGD
jgi:hypothetical protein